MDNPPTLSWEEVVRTHSARVYHFAYRLTGNQHDAEDLTTTSLAGSRPESSARRRRWTIARSTTTSSSL